MIVLCVMAMERRGDGGDGAVLQSELCEQRLKEYRIKGGFVMVDGLTTKNKVGEN